MTFLDNGQVRVGMDLASGGAATFVSSSEHPGNLIYEHRTDFVVGKLTEIRRRFNEMATKTPPAWRFATDRQHWTLDGATDQGVPLKGGWRVRLGAEKPRLESPTRSWRAERAPSLDLEIAYTGQPTTARVLWKRLDDDKFNLGKSLPLDLNPDGPFTRITSTLHPLPNIAA